MDTNYTKYSVLLIDDDPIFSHFVNGLVHTAMGAELIVSKDPLEAFDYLKSKKNPTLILLDMQLPKMDGLTTLKVIRSVGKTKNIPVIVTSGIVHVDLLQKLADVGISDYYLKGSPVTTLQEKINKVFAKIENNPQ